MHRSLMIPAAGCLFAFAALVATLSGAPGREGAAKPQGPAPVAAERANKVASSRGDWLLPAAEAEVVLKSLGEEYLRPWRQWEKSPSRLYSRAAPRPIPSISAEIELARGATGESDSFLLAAITVRKGAQSQLVPCVVDRITKRVRFVSEGQWLTEDEWLKKAPMP